MLDQFFRNIYRDTLAAFAYDSLALVLAQEATHTAAHIGLTLLHKLFSLYAVHAQRIALIHERAVGLLSDPGPGKNLEVYLRHKSIIGRDCRYAHRNTVLGRASTAEESAFLKLPGSSF